MLISRLAQVAHSIHAVLCPQQAVVSQNKIRYRPGFPALQCRIGRTGLDHQAAPALQQALECCAAQFVIFDQQDPHATNILQLDPFRDRCSDGTFFGLSHRYQHGKSASAPQGRTEVQAMV